MSFALSPIILYIKGTVNGLGEKPGVFFGNQKFNENKSIFDCVK